MNCNNIPFGGTSRRNSDTSATSKGNTATSYKKVKENIGSLLLPTITLTFKMCFTGLPRKDCINNYIWEHSSLEYHDISMKSCAALIRPCIHLCLMIVSLFILYDIMLLLWMLYLYFTDFFNDIWNPLTFHCVHFSRNRWYVEMAPDLLTIQKHSLFICLVEVQLFNFSSY